MSTWCCCRQSSPASSSGRPDYPSPFANSASRQFSIDLLSPMPTPNMASSPLHSPGGTSLGRGLDDSPAISGTSWMSQRAASVNSTASVVSVLLPKHMGRLRFIHADLFLFACAGLDSNILTMYTCMYACMQMLGRVCGSELQMRTICR